MTTDRATRGAAAEAEARQAEQSGDTGLAGRIREGEQHRQVLDSTDDGAAAYARSHPLSGDTANGGFPMPQTVTAPAPMAGPTNEVTGVTSLVAHLKTVADKHAQIGTGEAFLGSLNRMEVGPDDQALVSAAQEASQLAGGAWKAAADAVSSHNMPLREQYSLNPSAGNKDANTNE